MNDNRNMLLAIVLSALVLIGWSFLSDKFFPTAGPQTQQVEDGKVKPVPQPQRRPRGRRASGDPRPRGRAGRNARAFKIETPRLRARSTSRARGSTIWCWSRERETIAKNSPPVRLLSPAGAKDSYFAQFGWTGQGVAAPDANSVWTASAPVLAPGKPVTLELDQPDRPAVRADHLGRRRLSVHRQAARRERRQRRGRAARLRPRQPSPKSPGSVDAGPSMSARSASSAARPTMTSTGKRSTRTRPASPATAAAAGSASPTNIG